MTNSNLTSNSTVAVGIVIHLADGTIQSCNTDAEIILGYSAEQLIGANSFEPSWQTIHQDGSPFTPETYPATISLRTGQPCSNVVMGFYQSSGDLVWLSIDTLPLCKANNTELYGVEVSFIDITAQISANPPVALLPKIPSEQILGIPDNIANRKQRSITLFESEQRLKLATDASGIGMWFWDLVEDTLEWTELGRAIFGLPRGEELNFEKCFKKVHPEDRDLVQKAIDEAIVDRTEYRVEYRVVWLDDSIHWVVAKGRSFYNRDGEPVRMIGTVQDITASKESEQQLRENEAALNQSKQLLRKILDSLIIYVGVLTPDGILIDVNRTALQAVNLKLEDALNKPFAQTYWWSFDSEIQDRLDDAIKRAAAGETVRYDTTARIGENQFIHNDFCIVPIFDDEGKVKYLIASGMDISDRKKIEQTLQQQTEDLIQANRLKDEFLAIVSHELRTPLNPILGWSQLLLGGRLDAEKTSQGIAIIERNARLQAQLINDLLDVSRILRGELNLEQTPLDLEVVIRLALTTVQLAAEAKSIQVETRFEPNIGQVLGDAGRLQQVVWNLVSNAIKFTPEDGEVTVTLERHEQYALIQVKDTGNGIEPEFLPFVFERFRQAESSSTREFGGLGLGLAIVRHLTELHGGTVTVASPGLNQGAIFRVKLPLMNAPAIEPIDNEPVDRSNRSNRFSGIKILVVDDEADSLDLVTMVLKQEGASVRSVTSAEDALEAFNEFTPDLIISDIGMPKTNGYTLITQIRQLPRGKDVPAIALTAYAGQSDRQSSMNAGFQKHISKPINIAELITTIKQII